MTARSICARYGDSVRSQHAPHTRLSSSAPELGRSRRRDRFLHAPFPEHAEDDVGRLSGAQITEQCDAAVQQGCSSAADAAADGDLAFRLARHRFPPEPGNLQEPYRYQALAAL